MLARRDPAEVEILPVTKTVSAERLEAARALGLTHFGENRVQEAEAKAPALPDVSWAMIGRLQSNKTARAVQLFGVIQSVDSAELAERIARAAAEGLRTPYPIYLQVNVDDDPAKAGFDVSQIEAAAARLAAVEGLEIRGLMTVGRAVSNAEQARPTFRALRELSERLRFNAPVSAPGCRWV